MGIALRWPNKFSRNNTFYGFDGMGVHCLVVAQSVGHSGHHGDDKYADEFSISGQYFAGAYADVNHPIKEALARNTSGKNTRLDNEICHSTVHG